MTPGPALHEHTASCWWDHAAGRWSCPDPSPGNHAERRLVDVRDMVVVHTALLREFRLAPDAVTRAGTSPKAVRQLDRHLGLLCGLLHHHHAGEDTLLWPRLRARLPAAGGALDRAEAQHEELAAGLEEVTRARAAWTRRTDDGTRAALVTALRGLHAQLSRHLDEEERTLLPLAAAALSAQEWHTVGEAAVAAMPKPALLLTFGMFAYEGDPAVLRDMLRSAPALPRLLLPRLAPRAYARRARQVYGTARP